MNNHTDLLHDKISNSGYIRLIRDNSRSFSAAEHALLREILGSFEFDAVQAQALAQAVVQQARFDPNALHIGSDDEDTAGICPHCINPPMPPLRDYLVWRQRTAGQSKRPSETPPIRF
ncbi:hypothetical protein [Neisseria musculi]|uniref:Uncharacterized protein n=1 Tax=Neisseria musculi TaxID=1815583 RepID=A0A7H1MCP3_9NEIS|nr:hypothetical protein [Neisseria musculi]QNT59408.1 hypothetical protein H7A79_1680 [Neisseria musculi]